MAQTCPLIAPVQPILHRGSCSNETLPNAPKHYEMLQNMSLDPMGWIECILCEKFRWDFMAQTCALSAPVQPVLHRVSFSNDTIQNAPKHYETHKTRGHGPIGWIGCVRCQKLWCEFMARTCALIAPVQPILHQVSCSNEHWQMHPKLWNAPKHEFRVQCGGSGVFVAKNSNAT